MSEVQEFCWPEKDDNKESSKNVSGSIVLLQNIEALLKLCFGIIMFH